MSAVEGTNRKLSDEDINLIAECVKTREEDLIYYRSLPRSVRASDAGKRIYRGIRELGTYTLAKKFEVSARTIYRHSAGLCNV